VTTEGGPLEAIVLAAGSGRRFGGAKLSSPWRGGHLIDGALAAAFAAPVRRVLLVTGADPEGAPAARAFAVAHGVAERLSVVFAEDHEHGLSASLRAGLAAVADDAIGAFVFLGDMPLVPPTMASRLAEVLKGDILAATPLHEDQRGHPALFARALFPRLSELSGDRGARGVLDSLGDRLALVETGDPGVLYDVDRPRDLMA
jgi:molybdenum cofactor cytidylyltransferase